jgi:hypothetical protein
MKTAIADVPFDNSTLKAVEENPRATMYGFLPIWPFPTNSRSFYVWVIPANVVFPFRPFVSEILQDVNGRVIATYERLPKDQVTDMEMSCPEFINLTPLSLFERKGATDEDIMQVVSSLTSKKRCKKYPLELDNLCITCWIDYLSNEFYDKVDSLPFNNPESASVAKETASRLVSGMSKALDAARRRIDIAIRDMDDPRSGKESFTDNDMLAVYHTHSERPKYKTTVGSEGTSKELMEILKVIKDTYGTNAEVQKALIEKLLENKAEVSEAASGKEKQKVVK